MTPCTSCGDTEHEQDEAGLCVYCQPCPYCGRYGTGCDDERGPRGCDPAAPTPPAVTLDTSGRKT